MGGLFESSGEGRDPLEGLNDAQRAAATYEGGPLIVLAGPGTGKTRVIVARIAHLIARGVDPKSILALTFTNKAANEMRDRLAEAIGPSAAEGVGAFTFNGFGAHLLRRFSDLAGLPHEPGLIDSAQRMRLMRRVVAERGLFRDALASGVDSAIVDAGKLINAMHCAALTVDAARTRLEEMKREIEERRAGSPSHEDGEDEGIAERARAARLLEVVSLWEGFDEACLEEGLVSFDDQVGRTNRLLARSDVARAFVRADYRHLVVDEFQDVNAAQIELLRLVAPPDANHGEGPDLCVVGDDDQAIYGFRGADDRAFERFEQTWTGVRTIPLEENYRSASPVLAVAASVIGRAHARFRDDKVIRRAASKGTEPAGAVVEAVRLENFRQAGEVIASMITASLAGTPARALSSHAVIARTWGELDTIRGALEVEGIRARMARSRPPSEDDGVLDVLAWVDLLLHPQSTWSARRILRRPPNQLGVEAVVDLERRYRATGSRVEQAEPFALWAAGDGLRWTKNAGCHDSPSSAQSCSPGTAALKTATSGTQPVPPSAILERFRDTWSALRDLASTASAATVIGEIVRRTGVVHADLLDGRARAARVAAVVGLLRFVDERSDRLEQPGDLRAFMDYYDDLDDNDRKLAPDRLSHEPVDGDEVDENGEDAVQLLTAHGAKGLEFDTVFVPRVESTHGYPSVRKPDEATTLPDWMMPAVGGDAGGGRTTLEALQDEERRLFYVACTRAERRLVLLGKVPKKSSSLNFMVELLNEGGLVVEREAAEVLGPHAGDDLERRPRVLAWDASERRRETLRSARRLARLEAAAALDAADRAGLDASSLESTAARLADASRRLATIARAEAGEALPEWLDETDLRTLYESIATADADSPAFATAADAVLRKQKPPFTLSYTAIYDWEKCPRCYFVKNILRLPEPEGAPIVVGKVTHEALERFYTLVKRAGERGEREPGLDRLLAIGDEVFEAHWDESEVIDHEQRDRVRALLTNGYAKLHDATVNVTEVEKTHTFMYDHRGRHKIVAKIDRVDESDAGFRLVDYKTGAPKKYQVEPEKDDLQFGIYALAIRASLNDGKIDGVDIPAGVAEYWVLSTGQRGVIGFDELAKAENKTRKKIEAVIDGLLDGRFARGKDCWGACAVLDPGHVKE
ncbi:MAG: ATP-dependent helicase [Phycisphaeraceae bacterium]|nr:MAG: ATP-dependent helicase [Phycisphaeraceae bacterium]